MLSMAFKEWAVICQALSVGRQSIILRKGGIAESGGTFRPEHDRFWLYPTFVHQQAGGTKPEAAALLHAANAAQPAPGRIRFQEFVEVGDVRFVDDLAVALSLNEFHIWSPETVTMRFHYRTPGLYVLPVRVYRVPVPFDAIEQAEYAGCKTWVELQPGYDTAGAIPVLTDAGDTAIQQRVMRLLN